MALGCGNFGGIGSSPAFFGQGTDEEDAIEIMDRAWANGIHWFDTADAYGGGRSETFIGRWRAANRPEGLVLTTKVFHSTVGNPDDTGLAPDRIRRQLEGSLSRLGVDRVDLYLAHEPDPRTPLPETIACFERLVEEGLIGAWGLSNYDHAGIAEGLRHGRPALVQNAYSLLDRGDEEGVLPLCEANAIAYVPFGPLSGGWLTGKYERGAPFPAGSRMTLRPEPYEQFVDDGVFDALDRLRAEADSLGVSMAALAFAWVLAAVDGAVCGPNRASQLDAIFAAQGPHPVAGRPRPRRLFFLMTVRILDEHDVRRLLPMDECIDVMADALAALARGEVHNPLRFVVRPPGEASLMGLMPAHRGGDSPLYALKAIAIFPGNSARGLDSHQGFVALFDGETGATRALLNAGAITAVRTAAVSGVATRLLARDDARTLAILGTGIQGQSHLDAMRAVRDFDRVVVWSRTPGRIAGVEEAGSAEEAVQDADVIVTATSAAEPIIERAWLKPGVHINAVGSSIPTTRELDTATMRDAALFVDRRESTVNEAGDFLFPQREGAIGPENIRAEIGELLVGSGEGRRSPDELTVFKSLGLAVEDLAAAEHVLRRAEAEDVGQVISL